jgi:putative phosphoesterase
VIAIIADTHMPRGARRLPERCVELLREAEAVVHAGDFFGLSALEEVEALCPRVHAVHGNVDEPVLRERLPEELAVGLPCGRLAVVHDAGPAKGRLARLRRRFPVAEAAVFGHSHLPLHEVAEQAEEGRPRFQIFNPGSPTERRRAPRASMGLLHCENGGIRFEHVWL